MVLLSLTMHVVGPILVRRVLSVLIREMLTLDMITINQLIFPAQLHMNTI